MGKSKKPTGFPAHTGKQRLFAVGFDSAEVRLLRKWGEAGRRPNLRRLMFESLRARLRNPQAFEAGAVWPNFVTGMPMISWQNGF